MTEAAILLAPGLEVLAAPHTAFGVLRLGRDADPTAIAAIGRALQIDLPEAPNRSVGDRLRALWTGPLEWTLIDASPAELAALESACVGRLSHYADLTDARVGLRIVGANAAALIASECPLDLSEAALAPGRCAQSLFADVPILIDRREGEGGFRLYVDVSLAAHLIAWLRAAAEGLA
ncbi:MAG TPA: sarcosine oxidase subunit gamma family protein [Caulobacteraceae bacterium]